MSTKPDFTKKNVISDSGMMDAFKEGLIEGTANLGKAIGWLVDISFEGTALNNRLFEDVEEAMAFVAQNIETVGMDVRIRVRWTTSPSHGGKDSAPKAIAQSDDDIVDAEVVEN